MLEKKPPIRGTVASETHGGYVAGYSSNGGMRLSDSGEALIKFKEAIMKAYADSRKRK